MWGETVSFSLHSGMLPIHNWISGWWVIELGDFLPTVQAVALFGVRLSLLLHLPCQWLVWSWPLALVPAVAWELALDSGPWTTYPPCVTECMFHCAGVEYGVGRTHIAPRESHILHSRFFREPHTHGHEGTDSLGFRVPPGYEWGCFLIPLCLVFLVVSSLSQHLEGEKRWAMD